MSWRCLCRHCRHKIWCRQLRRSCGNQALPGPHRWCRCGAPMTAASCRNAPSKARARTSRVATSTATSHTRNSRSRCLGGGCKTCCATRPAPPLGRGRLRPLPQPQRNCGRGHGCVRRRRSRLPPLWSAPAARGSPDLLPYSHGPLLHRHKLATCHRRNAPVARATSITTRTTMTTSTHNSNGSSNGSSNSSSRAAVEVTGPHRRPGGTRPPAAPAGGTGPVMTTRANVGPATATWTAGSPLH